MKMKQMPTVVCALKRHLLPVALIAVQCALVVAVVSNCVVVIFQATSLMRQQTGFDLQNSGVIQSIGVVSTGAKRTSVDANLRVLDALPSVESATFGNVPLSPGTLEVTTTPGSADKVEVYSYDGSQNYVRTLGLKILSGVDVSEGSNGPAVDATPSVYPAMVTEALRARLFGASGGMGQVIFAGDIRLRVVGIIERLKGALSGQVSDDYALVSTETYSGQDRGGYYVIRAKAGRLAQAMREAQSALERLNPGHVTARLQAIVDIRSQYLGQSVWLARVLAVTGMVMLIAMGLGAGALTSAWVLQRTAQIGLRRALGATRADILRYFLLENLLIVVPGVVGGLMFAFLINAWLIDHLELPSMGTVACATTALVVVAVNQLCTLGPALQGSRVSPSLAVKVPF